MSMMFCTASGEQGAEIRDETGRIGALFFVGADPEDPEDPEDPGEGWVVELRGFQLGDSRSTDYWPTVAEAVAAARPLYEELLEYRRLVARLQGRVRFISTPMGGQPR